MNKDKTGIGFADTQNSFEAGQRAATEAFKTIRQKTGSLVFAFCTGKHDYKACFNGIKSVVGNIPVIGGSAIGIITNDYMGYEGYQVGAAILPNDLSFDTVAVGGLDKGEKEVGLKLGRQLSVKRNPKEKLLFLFYDSIKFPPPPAPILNVSSYLIEGFNQGIGENPPLLVGAGLIGSYSFNEGKQFCCSKVAAQYATATLLSGAYSTYITIMHGCKPMGSYHEITRIEGPVVYEIDGKPALDVIDDLLGTQDWHQRLPLLLVTLGVNYGNKYAPYNEENYVNRLIVGIKPEEKSVVLFEADFENGTEFQFMRRNARLMEESVEKGSKKAITYLQKNNLEPFFALYIDCAGRTAGFSGAGKEEASIIQNIIGKNIPLLGFYSGVEIAPLLGKSRGLDWTGVLLILNRSKQS